MVGKKPTLEAARQNGWVGVVAFFSHSCRLRKLLKFSFSLGHDPGEFPGAVAPGLGERDTLRPEPILAQVAWLVSRPCGMCRS